MIFIVLFHLLKCILLINIFCSFSPKYILFFSTKIYFLLFYQNIFCSFPPKYILFFFTKIYSVLFHQNIFCSFPPKYIVLFHQNIFCSFPPKYIVLFHQNIFCSFSPKSKQLFLIPPQTYSSIKMYIMGNHQIDWITMVRLGTFFFGHLYKGDNFCDFQFALLHSKSLLKSGLL